MLDAEQVGKDGDVLLYRLGEGTLLVSKWNLHERSTDDEHAEAQRVLDLTSRSIVRDWTDVAAAEAAGYSQVDDLHWLRLESMLDQKTVNPNDPEGLMYIRDPDTGELLLLAALYIAPGHEHGPQFGGPETVWHYHDYEPPMCMRAAIVPIGLPSDGKCPSDSEIDDRSPEMIHVWLANPAGSFDHNMNVGPELIAETKKVIASLD